MGEPVRVSIVALDPVLEAGTRSTLQSSADVAVALPTEAAEVAVVIVDRIARQALDVVRATRNAPHRPEVVLVATDLAPTEAAQAIAAGARGLLRRTEASADRLARTVLAAAGGDCTVPPELLEGLLDLGACPPGTGARATSAGAAGAQGEKARGGPGAQPPRGAAGLSERERAVLRLVADGRETGEIARELCYSARTVTAVVHDVTQRFGLRNRAHAVAYALRAGLL
ncbi:LuxR C-terminal-related transcriptional regulator [Kitasatospora sp. NBC_01250]|uniref:helix-turn-helix transcriptional regulator n=1 Tax=unclassified Kitasatospora TaxID=2633591 RepID=UPI002E12ADCB|nr:MULTISPECIES: LuxR C-terminal-related transcriptional regulator [unclassified Kitasatospora]WSJ65584.1 LuxR C-terminal-related transcriptional regulator [Kitasatospora sp. NBC_01302]